MTPREAFYNILGGEVVKNLEKRGFDARYVSSSAEALEQVKRMVPEGSLISWGGTMTLEETGIKSYLKSGKFDVIDRATANGPDEIKEAYHKSLNTDYYFMSTNAVTRDGILVNIDGNGNRLAALIYGPENIIIIAGMNKIVNTEADAVPHIQNTASPLNAHRLGRQTPCLLTGSCGDCLSPDSMCSHTVSTRRSHPGGRIKVILVGEELGY